MSTSGKFTISNDIKTMMRKRVNKRIHLDQEVMITFIFKTGMIIYDYESTLILVPYLEFFKITILDVKFHLHQYFSNILGVSFIVLRKKKNH